MYRVLGIDASSSSAGAAIIEDGIPVQVDVHISNKKLDLGERLINWGRFLNVFRAKRKLHLVSVERVGKQRNLNTVRMLAYFEAAAMMKAGEWGVPVLQLSVPTIRKQAMGDGKATKAQVYQYFSNVIPVSPWKKGGDDMTDACAVGVAGYILNGK